MSEQQLPLVHVIDDEEGVRVLLREMLTCSGFEVRLYEGPFEFLAQYVARSPQCLLVDVRLPRMSGLELQRRIAGDDTPPVILFSGVGTLQTVVRAFRQGAEDYLEKPFELDALLDAVQRAIEKDRTREQARRVCAQARAELAALTAREHQVLSLVAQGRSSKNVAFELGLSKKTVDLHRGNVMRKLGAHSLPELLRIWIRAGGTLEASGEPDPHTRQPIPATAAHVKPAP